MLFKMSPNASPPNNIPPNNMPSNNLDLAVVLTSLFWILLVASAITGTFIAYPLLAALGLLIDSAAKNEDLPS